MWKQNSILWFAVQCVISAHAKLTSLQQSVHLTQSAVLCELGPNEESDVQSLGKCVLSVLSVD